MPVEETANMHLMLAAIAQQKGNTTDFVSFCCLYYLHRHLTHDILFQQTKYRFYEPEMHNNVLDRSMKSTGRCSRSGRTTS